MLLPLKFICSQKKTRRDGTSIIYIQYCYSSDNKTLLNTEIAIPPKYWHKKYFRIIDDLPEEYGRAANLNKDLQKQFRIAEDIIQFALKENYSDPVQFAKEHFKPNFDVASLEKLCIAPKLNKPKINLDFFFQFDQYMQSKEKKVTPGMMRVYNNVKGVLLEFQLYRKSNIQFEEIDFNFYEDLVDYLLFHHIHKRKKVEIKGLKISSAGKIIKQLRNFLRNRMRKKIIASINLEDFKILDEEADAIYLNEEEILKIYETDLSKVKHLENYRNMLVFGCLTGLRFSDFSTIKPEDVRGKRLYKKQGKSDHWVVIPLREEAFDIYVNRFKREIPRVSNTKFNEYIKEVGRVAEIKEQIKFSYKKGNKDIEVMKPKFGWITSHTCRRSFCTNEFLAGTPVELIMKISGHKSLRDFYRYIRITPEQAAIQIEKIWTERRTETREVATNKSKQKRSNILK